MTVDTNNRFYGCFNVLNSFLFRWNQHQITESGNDCVDWCRNHNKGQNNSNNLVEIRDKLLKPCKRNKHWQQKGTGHTKRNNTVHAPALHFHINKRGLHCFIFYVKINCNDNSKNTGKKFKICDSVK